MSSTDDGSNVIEKQLFLDIFMIDNNIELDYYETIGKSSSVEPLNEIITSNQNCQFKCI